MTDTDCLRVGVHAPGQVVPRHIRPPEAPFPTPRSDGAALPPATVLQTDDQLEACAE
jgi:hypothetical protein